MITKIEAAQQLLQMAAMAAGQSAVFKGCPASLEYHSIAVAAQDALQLLRSREDTPAVFSTLNVLNTLASRAVQMSALSSDFGKKLKPRPEGELAAAGLDREEQLRCIVAIQARVVTPSGEAYPSPASIRMSAWRADLR